MRITFVGEEAVDGGPAFFTFFQELMQWNAAHKQVYVAIITLGVTAASTCAFYTINNSYYYYLFTGYMACTCTYIQFTYPSSAHLLCWSTLAAGARVVEGVVAEELEGWP